MDILVDKYVENNMEKGGFKMIFRVTITANVYISAGSEDEAITKVQRMDKDNLDYLYFAERDECEHIWECSDIPGLFNCKCGAEGIWDKNLQKIEIYVHGVFI